MPSLSWWSIALAVTAGLVGLSAYLAGRRRAATPLPTDWRVDARPALNADERHAMRLLREALPNNVVLAKLPLVRFCQPREMQQMRYWFELIGPVYVSFAVCSANGRVLAVVDLDTGRPTSARALRIKQGVLDACRIRYVRCRADNFPAASDLALLLRPQGPTARVAPMAPPAQAAPAFQNAKGHLSDTVKSRRAQRSEHWPNSALAQDSFFAADSRLDAAANSDFAPSTVDTAPQGQSVRR
jgi:hypothetical protein